MSGGLGLLWDKYNEVLETNPLPTKAVTSLVGFTIGDLLAQSFLGEKGAPIDVKRLLRCVRASMRAVDSIALGVWGVGCEERSIIFETGRTDGRESDVWMWMK